MRRSRTGNGIEKNRKYLISGTACNKNSTFQRRFPRFRGRRIQWARWRLCAINSPINNPDERTQIIRIGTLAVRFYLRVSRTALQLHGYKRRQTDEGERRVFTDIDILSERAKAYGYVEMTLTNSGGCTLLRWGLGVWSQENCRKNANWNMRLYALLR